MSSLASGRGFSGGHDLESERGVDLSTDVGEEVHGVGARESTTIQSSSMVRGRAMFSSSEVDSSTMGWPDSSRRGGCGGEGGDALSEEDDASSPEKSRLERS